MTDRPFRLAQPITQPGKNTAEEEFIVMLNKLREEIIALKKRVQDLENA